MYGAIIGDLAGSIYEFSQVKEVKKIYLEKLSIPKNAFFSDDTILTMAVTKAILDGKDYETVLKEWILNYMDYHPNFAPYFKNAFSPQTIKWAQGLTKGESTGNGAMMRISPVGYLFNFEQDVINHAIRITRTSHNTKEALYASIIVFFIIFYSRQNISLEKIYSYLHLNSQYHPFSKFNTTCGETLENCLYALKISQSFEDALIKTIEMGGDTDTNACIVGSLAEAIYEIPLSLKAQAEEKIPNEFGYILRRAYQQKK